MIMAMNMDTTTTMPMPMTAVPLQLMANPVKDLDVMPVMLVTWCAATVILMSQIVIFATVVVLPFSVTMKRASPASCASQS